MIMLVMIFNLSLWVVEALQDILRVHQRNHSVEIDCAAKAIVDPEQRRNIARVRQPGCFKQNVVKRSLFLHETFDGIHARISALRQHR